MRPTAAPSNTALLLPTSISPVMRSRLRSQEWWDGDDAFDDECEMSR